MKKLIGILLSTKTASIITVAGIILTIYFGVIYEKAKVITLSRGLLSEVFDLHEPLSDLEITYRGRNLHLEGKTLWSVNFRIENSGQTGIKIGDFDKKSPLGVEVIGGEFVLDKTKYLASNDYIQTTIEPKTFEKEIILSPLIFEPLDYISFNVLVIGPEGISPVLKHTGIVSGTKIINETGASNIDNKSIGQKIINNDPLWVHIIRFFMYLFVVLCACIVGLILYLQKNNILNYSTRWNRRKILRKYKDNENLSKEARYTMSLYENKGFDTLLMYNGYVNVTNKNIAVKTALKDLKDNSLKSIVDSLIELGELLDKKRVDRDELEAKGFLIFEGDSIKYTELFDEELFKLIKFTNRFEKKLQLS